jgi:hypothetical protein
LNPLGHWRWDRQQNTLRWIPRTAPLSAEERSTCQTLTAGHVVMWPGALARRPGEVIFPRPYAPGHAPGFEKLIPGYCLDNWSLSADAPAVIDAATGAVLLRANAAADVSPKAFSVRTWAAQGKYMEGALLAFNPALQPLVGHWQQTGEQDCAPGSPGKTIGPLADFELTPDGQFSWRRERFERRYDAWGRYRHDFKSGAVEFHIEGGNETRGLESVSGQASITGEGRMEMVSLVFKPDSTAPAAGVSEALNCRWTLTR